MAKILVVDDEQAIVDILVFNLKKEGYETVEAYDGEEALEVFARENIDLILLDLMMPRLDGIKTCEEIRKSSNVPIIMLTAKAEELDKVLGLETGADDYVTKPFGIKELMARVKANMRKGIAILESSSTDKKVIRLRDLVIDMDRFEAKKRGRVLELTLKEFELLKCLAVNMGQIFSREELLNKVWNYEFYGDLRTVDVAVRRLREKLEDNSQEPEYVHTKRGVGYYFE